MKINLYELSSSCASTRRHVGLPIWQKEVQFKAKKAEVQKLVAEYNEIVLLKNAIEEKERQEKTKGRPGVEFWGVWGP